MSTWGGANAVISSQVFFEDHTHACGASHCYGSLKVCDILCFPLCWLALFWLGAPGLFPTTPNLAPSKRAGFSLA
jgi:hypothetical protein